jgi:DNA (cytosine-5)-methyltransferase 1
LDLINICCYTLTLLPWPEMRVMPIKLHRAFALPAFPPGKVVGFRSLLPFALGYIESPRTRLQTNSIPRSNAYGFREGKLRRMGNNRYTVLSLFSGGMGLDLGIEQTGRFTSLACVELVPAFCATIRTNRDAGRISNRELKVFEGDIRNLDPQRVMDELGLKPGDLDLLIGGPPCQSFSTTGRRGTVQDPRGTLLWQFLRYVEVLQPKLFVMENVRGLMSAALRHRPIKDRPEKGGLPLAEDEQPGSVIRLFIKDLHDAYRLDCFEVNAVNYGAPQLRERAIFIGNRLNRVVEFPSPTHSGPSDETPSLFDFDKEPALPAFKTLGEALAGLDDMTPIIMDFSPRKKRYLEMVPPGGNWRTLPEAIARESMGKAFTAKGGRSGWWRRLSFDLPAPTIVTMPNHAGTSLCHPTETRALTLRECARVQEFPDNWEFRGKTMEQYAQVGNAVPVRLGVVCGEVAAKELDSIYAENLESNAGETIACRVVYIKSHVRTRQWYRAGQTFLWQDGEDNDRVRYGPAKTDRKVREL